MLLKSIYPRQGSKTDQSMDTTKLQLGEPVSFLGDTYRNMDILADFT